MTIYADSPNPDKYTLDTLLSNGDQNIQAGEQVITSAAGLNVVTDTDIKVTATTADGKREEGTLRVE